MIVETLAASTAPQIRSTIVITNGKFLSVARLVRSYVAYVTNPKNAPYKSACCHDDFAIAGEITKIINPAINTR